MNLFKTIILAVALAASFSASAEVVVTDRQITIDNVNLQGDHKAILLDLIPNTGMYQLRQEVATRHVAVDGTFLPGQTGFDTYVFPYAYIQSTGKRNYLEIVKLHNGAYVISRSIVVSK